MKIVIIGAGGFVGAALCRALMRYAPDIDVLPLKRTDLDVTRPETWRPLDESVDCVIHSAARDSGDRYQIFNVNALMAGRLAEHCNAVGLRKLIYLSTGAVYGRGSAATSPATECDPQGDYAVSKYLAERKLLERFSGRLNILRLYFPYGPGQREPRLIPCLTSHIRIGKPMTCNTDGGPRLTLSHVDDLSRSIVKDFVLCDNPTRIVNLASDQIVALETLIRNLGACIGTQPRLEFTGSQPDVLSIPYTQARWRPFSAADALGLGSETTTLK